MACRYMNNRMGVIKTEGEKERARGGEKEIKEKKLKDEILTREESTAQDDTCGIR